MFSQSQALTFEDESDLNEVSQADFDFRDFTLPSQSQTQASQLDHHLGASQVTSKTLSL